MGDGVAIFGASNLRHGMLHCVCCGLLHDYRTNGALLVINRCDGDAVCISFRGQFVHDEVLDSKDEKLNK